MSSSGMLRHVALVRTDMSEEPSASFIRVTRIGSPILVTLMKEALGSSETSVLTRATWRKKTPFCRGQSFWLQSQRSRV
jgi:hypothetical protein